MEKNIICSEGTTGAMFANCMALLNPGDEVIIPAPYYQYHVFTVQMCGGKPVMPKLGPPPAWKFDADSIQESITKKTKAIIINTPSNPSGKVYSMAELKALRDICVDNDLFCFTDEIYEYFVYDDLKRISPGSLDGMEERTMTISGYSKSFKVNGLLGSWNTSLLSPGNHQLSLVVSDNQGQTLPSCIIQVRVTNLAITPQP